MFVAACGSIGLASVGRGDCNITVTAEAAFDRYLGVYGKVDVQVLVEVFVYVDIYCALMNKFHIIIIVRGLL